MSAILKSSRQPSSDLLASDLLASDRSRQICSRQIARVKFARVRSLASNLLAWRESFLLKRSSVSFISKIRQENKDQKVVAPKIAV